ncbi:hypothetical protein ACOSP7_003908 [Xanthoceras sorbifolium]
MTLLILVMFSLVNHIKVRMISLLTTVHVGKSTFLTPSHSFSLSNVLCVPSMKQNLIYVSSFCKTNNASIELFPYSFCVKDLATGAALVKGQSKNNIYEWSTGDVSTIRMKQACMGVKTSLSNWDNRIGHPSSKILHQIVYQNHLPIFFSSSRSSFRDSYQCNKIHKLPF